MKITGSNVTLHVSDLQKSIDFYTALGCTLKNRWGDYYAQVEAPGIVIGLHPSKEVNQNCSGFSIGFTADSFEAAQALLQALAVTSQERREAGGHFIHFNDPDGYPLYFIDPKR